MKFISLFLFLLLTSSIFAQVGINTQNPQASLDIQTNSAEEHPDGLLIPRMTVEELNKKESYYGADQNGSLVYITEISETKNKTLNVKSPGFHYYNHSTSKWVGFKTTEENDNDDGGDNTHIYNSDGTLSDNRSVDLDGKNLVFMNDGNIGIGTDEPTASLHIAGQIAPLRIENLEQGDIDFDDLLVTDKDGVVKNIGNLTDLFAAFSIPTPAVFSLNTSITNFLNGYNSGAKQTIPMVEVNNSIKGLKFNKSTNTITLPRGTYQFSLSTQ